MKSVRNLLADEVIDPVDLLPDGVEVEAAVHDLHPQMIFLIDHQADLLLHVDRNRAGPLAIGVLAADELPLNEELSVKAVEFVDLEIEQLARLLQLADLVAEVLFNFGAVGRAGFADERKLGEVSRET